MTSLTALPIWTQLQNHAKALAQQPIQQFFSTQVDRTQKYSLEAAGLLLDYSKQRINTETLSLLTELAKAQQLSQWQTALFSGQALGPCHFSQHVQLRCPENLAKFAPLFDVANKVRQQQWLGHTGKPITDVVNIGIGGSDLGPALITEALPHLHPKHCQFHYLSNVDPNAFIDTTRHLDPETTLFIVTSKTFGTIETLCNARSAKQWLNNTAAIHTQMLAITAAADKAQDFGINPAFIFSMPANVSGRYSLWSAVGLSSMIAIGPENFQQLLAGAHALDNHFKTAPYEENLPVLLAMLGIWNSHFFEATTHAVLPYAQRLNHFVSYLQQLSMESNGKRLTVTGDVVDYPTQPIIWGGIGCNGQHAYHQLLHQGTHCVPCDFIIQLAPSEKYPSHQQLLLANCLSQAQALMQGDPAQGFPGNQPTNLLTYHTLDAKTLGALLALYEHKTFVQACIWQINPFDQKGVELGKQLAITMLEKIASVESSADNLHEHYQQYEMAT